MTISHSTGNKGEWSEVYTLFKILGDTKLYAGDHNVNRIEGVIYPIICILRTEAERNYKYSIQDNLVLITGNDETLKIPIEKFKKNALYLLEKIRNAESSVFSVPKIKEFMELINCLSIKSSSTSKSDITIQIHDLITNQQPVLGFSIKSQLGNPSTLLNAGKTTNFVFEVSNIDITDQDITNINAISGNKKIKDRIEKLRSLGASLSFARTEQDIFSNNLVLIDSYLPEILAEIVYSFYSSGLNKVSELVDHTTNMNPLSYDLSHGHNYYKYKIKKLLTDIALGMMPSKAWQGQYEANGGYLIVKSDGDIVCYHIYNRNEFENYLVNNTKLDTASTSRHDFGSLYKSDGKLYFKLNLQIRFNK